MSGIHFLTPSFLFLLICMNDFTFSPQTYIHANVACAVAENKIQFISNHFTNNAWCDSSSFFIFTEVTKSWFIAWMCISYMKHQCDSLHSLGQWLFINWIIQQSTQHVFHHQLCWSICHHALLVWMVWSQPWYGLIIFDLYIMWLPEARM